MPTKKYGVNELREMFLQFFESKGHLRLPSFSLIPQNDASLLLINSGMAPMKPWFTGEQEPPCHRVCTCQKCIRTGDIDNIGHTARHGTYFEMLGNFSFGDYFKHEAIAWSWEFLTSPEWVGLDPERLYPSIYEEDDEAFEIWNKEIGIPAERIFRFGKADNFWEHGSGPCGPCSEIYYDRGERYGCGRPDCTVGCDCDRYMEVWNNVFSQFNNDGEGHYPELRERRDYITKVIRTEEENFARTIDGGMKIFNDLLAGHKGKGETVFSGADAFKLYDTYGFPIDLTIEMAAEQGLSVDEEAFKALMQEQKERARKAREALGDLGWAGVEFGKDVPETQFVGYDHTSVDDARVAALAVENEQAEELMPGVEAIVVLDKTPFYAEMGGQVADHGAITAPGGALFQVTDVQKNKGGKYMHYGKLTGGVLKLGDTVAAAIDVPRRKAVMRAHSATHLLDKALRAVLGDHVQQAGSLVEPDRLRFDFTHFSAMTTEELQKVEDMVNEAVLEGYEVCTDVLPIEEAKQRGAIALFGEKYGDTVRVVDMGHGYSVEFCGGTHLDNTAKVGVFHILSEFSVASGVRRIEAITGHATLACIRDNCCTINAVSEALKTKPAELVQKALQESQEIRELRHAVESFKAKEAVGEASNFLMGAREVGGLKVLTATLNDAEAERLRKMGDFLRDKDQRVVAVLSSVKDGKITFLCVCGKEAVAKGIKAGDIIKKVTSLCGGKGGGKPDSAMGGGSDVLKLDNALATVDDFVHEKLGL